MDEVSSLGRLDLLLVGRQSRPTDCSASSSDPMMEGPCFRFRLKRWIACKRLTQNGRLEKRPSTVPKHAVAVGPEAGATDTHVS